MLPPARPLDDAIVRPNVSFDFQSPTRIIVAAEASEAVNRIVEAERPGNVAVIVDRNVMPLAPVQVLVAGLRDLPIESRVVQVDAREPDTDFIDEFASQFKGDRPDLLIGLGGGSTLDLAKACAILAFNPGRAAEYQGRDLLPNCGCPTVMIPTTAGTGSEVTPGAVVLNRTSKRKGAISSRFMIPNYAILDPEMTRELPARTAAATGMDALAHAVESFTARCATPVTRMYSREAFRLVSRSLSRILRHDSDLTVLSDQQLGATLAGVAIFNSDTGACHSMAYALGIYFDVPHGDAIALLLPKVLAINITKGVRDYAELAAMLPEKSALSTEDQCLHFQRFVDRLVPDGVLPRTLEQYGIRGRDIEELAARGLDLRTALENNPVNFTLEDARVVLRQLVMDEACQASN